MEELAELRKQIEAGHYADALAIVDELEEMSRSDKINRIVEIENVKLLTADDKVLAHGNVEDARR